MEGCTTDTGTLEDQTKKSTNIVEAMPYKFVCRNAARERQSYQMFGTHI